MSRRRPSLPTCTFGRDSPEGVMLSAFEALKALELISLVQRRGITTWCLSGPHGHSIVEGGSVTAGDHWCLSPR